MKPIALLMIEHRLIERVVRLLVLEKERMEQSNSCDPDFIAVMVDFYRIYAERTHHGKEEEILFKALSNKSLKAEDARIMGELIEEHKYSSGLVGQMSAAREECLKGSKSALKELISVAGKLGELYPKHIEKEDQHFFLPAMRYFTQDEQDTMLRDFRAFDALMIHEKYKRVVETLEK